MTDDLVTAYLYRKDGRQYVQPGRDPSAAKWGWTETALVPATELTALRARLVEVEAVVEAAHAVNAEADELDLMSMPSLVELASAIAALGGTDGQ